MNIAQIASTFKDRYDEIIDTAFEYQWYSGVEALGFGETQKYGYAAHFLFPTIKAIVNPVGEDLANKIPFEWGESVTHECSTKAEYLTNSSLATSSADAKITYSGREYTKPGGRNWRMKRFDKLVRGDEEYYVVNVALRTAGTSLIVALVHANAVTLDVAPGG